MSSSSNTQSYSSILAALLPPNTAAPVLPPPSPPHSQKPRATNPDLVSAIASLELHPVLETLLHILNGDLASAHFLVRHMQSPPAWEGMALHALLHRYEGHISNSRAWYTDIAGCGVLEYIWAEKGDVDAARDPAAVHKMARKAIDADDKAKEEAGLSDKDAEAKHSAQNNADDKDATAVGTTAAQEKSKGLPKATAFLDRVAAVQGAATAPHKFDGGAEAYEQEIQDLQRISETECRRLLAWCEVKYGTEKLVDARSEYAPMSEKISEMATKQVMGGEGWRQF